MAGGKVKVEDEAKMHSEYGPTHIELRIRNWILTSTLAILISVGVGGFAVYAQIIQNTTLAKETKEGLKAVDGQLAEQKFWILDNSYRDRLQDAALKDVVDDYEPMPYKEPPK